MIRWSISAGSVLWSFLVLAQATAIEIDGKFDDWSGVTSGLVDAPESISGLDILSFSITNDQDHLFIKIEVGTEIDLTDDDVSHELFLYLDTDNDSNTGYVPQFGYGCEIGIDLSDRTAFYNVTPQSIVDLYDIGYTHSPTVTATQFEISIRRDAIPDGINPLFSGSSIKILFKESLGGDELPNVGSSFTYSFDNASVPFAPISTNRFASNDIRIMTYNTEQDGFLDAIRSDALMDVVESMEPDIIGFSECYSTTHNDVKALLDQRIPLGTTTGWFVVKDDLDLITASRWPFIGSWSSLSRQFPVYVDLPSSFSSDLLFTNAHLPCCTNDNGRQHAVDEFAAFVLDARSSGGMIDLPLNTPIVYGGDLNFVGFRQQLQTLLSGNIVNTGAWGGGAPLDWDNSELSDVVPRHTHDIQSFTWQNTSSSFPPGRLDLLVYSDAALQLENSFVLRTEIMPASVLAALGLDQNETMTASDHFPLIADFSLLQDEISIGLKVLLQGPFNGWDMNDDLRMKGLIPFGEPYANMGYQHVLGGGEQCDAALLALSGPNAVLDWILVELRSSNNATVVEASQSALLLKNGLIVPSDGGSDLKFSIPTGSYYVSVKHRNHLGVMTLNPVLLTAADTLLDLSDGSVPLFGLNAMETVNGAQVLWSGDVNWNGSIKYIGSENDRDAILSVIGGSVPTNTINNVYSNADVNMDGEVKYLGSNNDRDPILLNVGGSVPTTVRTEQLP